MKATKLTVTWTEKVKCQQEFTVTWDEVLAHLEVPEGEREDYIVDDEQVMDYLFDLNIPEASDDNEIDYDLVDTDRSDVTVIDVEPPVPPNQMTIETETEAP